LTSGGQSDCVAIGNLMGGRLLNPRADIEKPLVWHPA
jgi:hypothetical protein